MNKSLVYFSVLMILLGVGSGFYLLSLLGGIALIPALLSPTRPPVRRAPEQPRQEPRRIIPPPFQPPRPSEPVANPVSYVASPAPSQPTYPAALFPTAMFPSLSTMGSTPQAKETAPAKQEGRDELVEVGAILALLKLAFG